MSRNKRALRAIELRHLARHIANQTGATEDRIISLLKETCCAVSRLPFRRQHEKVLLVIWEEKVKIIHAQHRDSPEINGARFISPSDDSLPVLSRFYGFLAREAMYPVST